MAKIRRNSIISRFISGKILFFFVKNENYSKFLKRMNTYNEFFTHFFSYCPAIEKKFFQLHQQNKKDGDDAIEVRVILQFYDGGKLYNSRTLSNIAITHLLVILVAPSSSCIQLIKDSIKFTSSSHHKWALVFKDMIKSNKRTF